MLCLRSLLFAGLTLLSTPGWGLSHFSVSPEASKHFIEQCGSLPDLEQMQGEVLALLKARRTGQTFLPVKLDGLSLREIDRYDFRVLDELTSHRDSRLSAFADFYQRQRTEQNGWTVIDRFCSKPACKQRGRTRPADFATFNLASSCSDVLCASRAIFGAQRGIETLWAYLKFGVNLSTYSHVNADAQGFTPNEMHSLLISLEAMPTHLRAKAFENFGFFRFLRGLTLAAYAGTDTIANAEGAVFSSIERFSDVERLHVFIHELGHRAERIFDSGRADQEASWLAARDERIAVSGYARVNIREDFAETFVMYRLDPARLKDLSPSRYLFMKEKVFRGLEYLNHRCP